MLTHKTLTHGSCIAVFCQPGISSHRCLEFLWDGCAWTEFTGQGNMFPGMKLGMRIGNATNELLFGDALKNLLVSKEEPLC